MLEEIGLDEEGRRQLSVRLRELCAYQDLDYARQYADFVGRVWQSEQRFADRGWRLTRAVVANLYKLMAYKDEYEVARLATRPEAEERVRELFGGDVKLSYCLHPPTLRWMVQGKMRLGPWFRPILKLLAGLKWMRGGTFDPFAYTQARRQERELIGWYRRTVEEVLERVDEEVYGLAGQICAAPDRIRGYEEIKARNAEMVRKEVEGLLTKLSRAKRSLGKGEACKPQG